MLRMSRKHSQTNYRCYNEKAVFVAVATQDGLTAEQAAWKPEARTIPSGNRLRYHLYNNAYLQRLRNRFQYEIADTMKPFGGKPTKSWRPIQNQIRFCNA